MKSYIQIENPQDCCGCGACANACPCGAISMREDAAGFLYPAVDEAICVGCGKCKTVCVFGKEKVGAGGEAQVYAARSKDRKTLSASSSGGLFTELAVAVLAKGGAVFGAAFDDDLALRHICVTSEEELDRLRGSKYVQSDTGDAFSQVRELLKAGKRVLYVGTPCQIAGLKAYLSTDDENLLTADLICHGVPSVKMLREDIGRIAQKKKIEVKEVKFRDKQYGWGVVGSLSDGGKKVRYYEGNSPYYFYFLGGANYRESCYVCRFPSEGRQGDITLGDYWGISDELVKVLGGEDVDRGVSCILVNTEKGKRALDEIKDKIALAPTDRQSVEKRNKQLTGHSVRTPKHDRLMRRYAEVGYDAFAESYKKAHKQRAVIFVKRLVPKKIKRKLAKLLKG